MGTATVTIKEAFASVFTDDATVMLRVSGVPDNVILTRNAMPVSIQTAADPANAADVMGNVTLNTDTIIVEGRGDSRPGGTTEHANGNGRWGRTSISQSVSRGPSGPSDSLKLHC